MDISRWRLYNTIVFHFPKFPKISQNGTFFLNNPIFSQNCSLVVFHFPKFPKISQNGTVFLNNPIFSQNFSLVNFPFCPQTGKIFPVRDIFPVISQKFPKQDLNENPKRGNNDFPKNPKISQNFPPQVYFKEIVFPYFPKKS